MEFTEQELEKIEQLLEEARESIRNNERMYTHEEICKMFNVPILRKKERMKLMKKEMREYYKSQI